MNDDAARKSDLFGAPVAPRRRVPPVLPVSRFVADTRMLLERDIGLTWISGEISGCTRAASGHLYFTLKDASGADPLRVLPPQGAGARVHAARRARRRSARRADDLRGARRIAAQCGDGTPAGLGALYERFVQMKARSQPRGCSKRRESAACRHTRGGSASSRRGSSGIARRADDARAPFAVGARDPVSGVGAGRRRPREIAAAIRARERARERRCSDRLPRRRLARGSVGVQRGSRRARGVRVGAADRLRRWSRDRFHDLRFRRRRARAHANRCCSARRPRTDRARTATARGVAPPHPRPHAPRVQSRAAARCCRAPARSSRDPSRRAGKGDARAGDPARASVPPRPGARRHGGSPRPARGSFANCAAPCRRRRACCS